MPIGFAFVKQDYKCWKRLLELSRLNGRDETASYFGDLQRQKYSSQPNPSGLGGAVSIDRVAIAGMIT